MDQGNISTKSQVGCDEGIVLNVVQKNDKRVSRVSGFVKNTIANDIGSKVAIISIIVMITNVTNLALW